VTTSAVKVEIQAALTRRATADATAIEAEVRCAEVTLTGTVRSAAERELAIHSAWNLPGVHAVVDKLTLEQ
jgi:osmotically-inducible protein OsmY